MVPFLFDSWGVLRVVDRNGDPWFIASDVAALLGYRDAERVTRLLDDDEKGTLKVGTLGGEQVVAVISEPGFYKAVGRSQKPEAKRIDRWVRHEVLPAIRKTGAYTMPHATVIDPGQPPDEALDIDGALKLVNTVCRVWGVRAAQQAYLKLPVLLRVPVMFEPQQQPTLFDLSGQGGVQ